MTTKSTTLRFSSIKTLAGFIKTHGGAHFTSVIDLTVQGKFTQAYVNEACYVYGATVVNKNRKQTKQEDWYTI